jgi:hypothetical protein
LTLDPPAARSTYGTFVDVQGWLRGLGRARLQELGAGGWRTVAHLHPDAAGHFSVPLHAVRSTQLRLAYNGFSGDAVPFQVVPRVMLSVDAQELHVQVSPRLPLQVERLTSNEWRPVARANGRFDRQLRPGSYRVTVLGSQSYATATSRAVGLHL